MDHYGWDAKRADLIVSALGNDTVEIVNSWKRVHTIAGLEHPQACVYPPGVDRIAVSSQSASCNSTKRSRSPSKTLDFAVNANTDNMRYDPLLKHLYVGFGSARAALVVVDPAQGGSEVLLFYVND